MSREAMQMALEALEDANDVARMEFSDEDYYSEAINALRQALVDADDTSQERVDETAKQEHAPGPKAWQCQCGKAYTVTCISSKPSKRDLTCVCGAVWEGETMVHPPREREWVGLTDAEIHRTTVVMGFNPEWTTEIGVAHAIVRNLEAKLKEKNHG